MSAQNRPDITVADLTSVVYSSGRVFNELSTGRLDTEKFLRSGSLEGISSKSDLMLLEDLRDVSQFIIDHGQTGRPIDASYVRGVNATITRSGALHPGEFRRDDQQIGVNTRFGRHTPAAIHDAQLQELIDRALKAETPQDQSLNLFVAIAKAQPFEDGNKRTAIFVANGLLLREQSHELLTVPLADGSVEDPSFNELLARAYLYDEEEPVKRYMKENGFSSLPHQAPSTSRGESASSFKKHQADLADRITEIDRHASGGRYGGYQR